MQIDFGQMSYCTIAETVNTTNGAQCSLSFLYSWSQLRFRFEQVYHLIDFETILCMLNKPFACLKIDEGVRIGEIQTATKGDMYERYWTGGSEKLG